MVNKDNDGLDHDLDNDFSNQDSKQSKHTNEISKLKESLSSILLELQQDYEKKGKLLTADIAIQQLESYLTQKFKTKEMIDNLAFLLGKKSISFGDIKDVRITVDQTLGKVFQEKYLKHLDTINKWGLVDCYYSRCKDLLFIEDQDGSIQSFDQYMKGQKQLPIFDKSTQCRKNGDQPISGLPTWNKNYFFKLQSLLYKYAEYVKKQGGEDAQKELFEKISKLDVSIQTVTSHCETIGLYTPGMLPDALAISSGSMYGGGSPNGGLKQYNAKIKESIDPRNMISSLIDVYVDEESCDIVERINKNREGFIDYLSNCGGDLQGIQSIDKQSISNMSEQEIQDLKQTVMDSLKNQKQELAKKSGIEKIIANGLKNSIPGISDSAVLSHIAVQQQFWNDFYDLSKSEHKILDADGNEMICTIDKELIFNPGALDTASSINDLFSLSLKFKPQLGEDGNYTMMAMMAQDDVWSFGHEIPLYDGDATEKDNQPKRAFLQKSQLYRVRDETGNVVGEGYAWIDIEGDFQPSVKDGSSRAESPNTYSLKLLQKSPIQSAKSDDDIDKLIDEAISIPQKSTCRSIDQTRSGYSFEPLGGVAFELISPLSGGSDNAFSQYTKGIEAVQRASMTASNREKKVDLSHQAYVPASYLQEKMRSYDSFKKRYLSTKVVNSDKDPSVIPDYLKKENQGHTIHAWIDDGIIFLDAAFFIKHHGIDLETLSDSSGNLDIKKIEKRIDKASYGTDLYFQRRSVLLEIKRLTNHEKAHRVFHHYGLIDKDEPHDHEGDENHDSHEHGGTISIQTIHGEEVHLSNETLCVIAEGAVFIDESQRVRDGIHDGVFYELDEKTLRYTVTVTDTHGVKQTLFVDDIEKEIAKSIPGFTFGDIVRVDQDVLEKAYIEGNSLPFTGLLEARVGNISLENNPITAAMVRADRSKVFVLDKSDHLALINEPNVILVTTATSAGPLSNDNIADAKLLIDADLGRVKDEIAAGREIVFPVDNDGITLIGAGAAGFNTNPNASAVNNYLQSKISSLQSYEPDQDPERRNLQNQNQQNQQNNADQNPNQPNNNQPNQPNQSPENREQADDNVDNNLERDIFDKQFSELPGDTKIGVNLITKPEKGLVLYLMDGNSLRPGKNSDWAQLTIKEVEDDKIICLLTGHTERDLGDKAGQPFEIQRTPDGLHALKSAGMGALYKYNPIDKKSDFLQSAAEHAPGWSGITQGLEKKYIKDGKEFTAPITHIADIPTNIGPEDSQGAVYSIEMHGDSVTLTGKINDREQVQTTMDYTSFVHFMKDKKLQPYTQDEIDAAGKYQRKKSEKEGAPKHSRIDSLVSISMMIAAIKKIPQNYKQKMDQDTKLLSGEFYNRLLKGIPDGIDGGFFYLADMKADALAEHDGEVMQIIEEFKSRLNRSDVGDSGGMHANKTSDIIRDQIFGRDGNKTLTRKRDRLKAAGYLLFALESGGDQYYANLKDFNGKGLRVKALLGSDYQADYMKERNRLIDQYKTAGVENDELQDKLAKLELDYICKQCSDHPFFGTRFGRKVEDARDKWGKIDGVDGTASAIGNKGNIYDMYDAFKGGGIGGNKPHVLMGALTAMQGAVETPAHYSLFYQSVVMVLLSGYATKFSKAYMSKFKEICRKVGIPIGMLASDPHGAAKGADVIDYIAKQANIQSLSDYIKTSPGGVSGRNPAGITPDNYAIEGQDTIVAKKIQERWAQNGLVIIGAFNYKNGYLIKGLSDDNKPPAIDDYFGTAAVFNTYKDYKDTRGSPPPDGDSPFYDGILNVAPGTFQSYTKFYGDRFSNPQAAEMRIEFGKSVDGFKTTMESAQSQESKKGLLEFLLKKFVLYFGSGDNGLSIESKEYLEKLLLDPTISESDLRTEFQNMINLHILGNKRYQEGNKGRVVLKSGGNIGNIPEGMTNSNVRGALMKYSEIIIKTIFDIPSHRGSVVKKAFAK